MQKYKIVFGGPMGAGKSRAIKALSDIEVLKTEAYNTDDASHLKMLTTVGIDYGELWLDDGSRIGLYGTPGQDRFSFMWPLISKGALGIVVLVDHSAENPLQDLGTYLQAFKAHNGNLIIGVTHNDARPDRPHNMYRDWMLEQGFNYPLYHVDARERDDVLLLVETMIAILEVNLG